MINYIHAIGNVLWRAGSGPWELSPLFLMSWINNIQWQMELQRLYPAGSLLKVLCPLGVANVMLSFQESDPFPLYKQVS